MAYFKSMSFMVKYGNTNKGKRTYEASCKVKSLGPVSLVYHIVDLGSNSQSSQAESHPILGILLTRDAWK